MFEFNPFTLIFWLFAAFFVPGALCALAILKKREMPLFDKAMTGFGIGLLVPAFLAFVLLLLGVQFTYGISILCVALFYLFSIALFAKEKAWEGISIPSDYSAWYASIALGIIMLLAFWIRMQTYGPVFMELDPYFYIQHAALIISDGSAPVTDYSAWYPYPVSHRVAPMKSYLESITYALYNQGTGFDRYLLSAAAGMLPPVMAALVAFFVYLLVSSEYGRKFGIASAGVVAFFPMFIMKLMAGESELQPYAFFGIAFFLAMYALAIKRRDALFGALAGIAFLATIMGSSSSVVLYTALFIFIPLQALFLFFMKEGLEDAMKINGLVILIGPALSVILVGLFLEKPMLDILGQLPLLAMAYLFSAALLILQRKMPELGIGSVRKAAKPIGIILLAAVIIMAFTPVGEPLTSLAKNTLSIADYNQALDRTIAEQGGAGASFEGELGFIGMDFTALPTLDDLLQNFSQKNVIIAFFDLAVGLLQHLFALIAFLFTSLSNLIIAVSVSALNLLFGTSLQYNDKNNSMLMVIFFAMFASIIHSAWLDFKERKQPLALLFAAFIFPISLIGLFKTKYAIYLGFAVSAGLGISLGEIYRTIEGAIGRIGNEEARRKYLGYAMIGATLACFFFVYFEWSGGLASKLFSTSFQPRFQDNPQALQPRMEELCLGTGYPPACEAAGDPVGFASGGTTSQYDPILCIYSLYSDISAPTPDEQISASLRCNMLSSYWIEFYEWMYENSPEDARFTSWWDYGHWTNYFGHRDTVLRNDHARHDMILEVAHGFLYGTPQELRDYMLGHDSEYVFFDREIIMDSSGAFGMKYSALNYLSCSRNNETSLAYGPGESACEIAHTWERLAIPASPQPCVISAVSGETGMYAYNAFTGKPEYCVGTVELLSGQSVYAMHELNETYANGDLKLHKGLMRQVSSSSDVAVFDVYYTKDPVWLENGEARSGWEDRTTKFYDSVLYQAFVLDEVEGFTKVYETSDGSVKLFRVSD